MGYKIQNQQQNIGQQQQQQQFYQLNNNNNNQENNSIYSLRKLASTNNSVHTGAQQQQQQQNGNNINIKKQNARNNSVNIQQQQSQLNNSSQQSKQLNKENSNQQFNLESIYNSKKPQQQQQQQQQTSSTKSNLKSMLGHHKKSLTNYNISYHNNNSNSTQQQQNNSQKNNKSIKDEQKQYVSNSYKYQIAQINLTSNNTLNNTPSQNQENIEEDKDEAPQIDKVSGSQFKNMKGYSVQDIYQTPQGGTTPRNNNTASVKQRGYTSDFSQKSVSCMNSINITNGNIQQQQSQQQNNSYQNSATCSNQKVRNSKIFEAINYQPQNLMENNTNNNKNISQPRQLLTQKSALNINQQSQTQFQKHVKHISQQGSPQNRKNKKNSNNLDIENSNPLHQQQQQQQNIQQQIGYSQVSSAQTPINQTERHQSVNNYNLVNNKMIYFNQINKKQSQIDFKQPEKCNQGAQEDVYMTVQTLQTQGSEYLQSYRQEQRQYGKQDQIIQENMSNNNTQQDDFNEQLENRQQVILNQKKQQNFIKIQDQEQQLDQLQQSQQKKVKGVGSMPSQQMQQLYSKSIQTKKEHTKRYSSTVQQQFQQSQHGSKESHSIKMPGKMKQNLEDNNQQQSNNTAVQNKFINNDDYNIGDNLFEQFLVVGPNKSELSKADQLNNRSNIEASRNSRQTLYLPAKMDFQYPEQSNIQNLVQEDIIKSFAFPKGVETDEYDITDSLSQISEIIFSNNIVEKNNVNCYVFAIKTEQNQDLVNKQRRKKHKHRSQHQKLLEVCNPQNFLYGICFKIKEVMDKEKHSQNNQQQNKTFWCTQKVFCFLTFFPFIQFFFDIITSMLNQMKMKRVDFYAKNLELINNDKESNDIIKRLELDFFKNFMNNDCKKILLELSNIQMPSINTKLQLKYNDDLFQYNVPEKKLAKHIEAEWSTCLVLSTIEEEVFALIYLSILCENQIVFVSQNSALLSSSLLIFHSLLKPFKWPHPLIFNLPDDFMHLLDSPVPILLGLNRSSEFVYDHRLDEKHPNCVFVMLDNFTDSYYNIDSQYTQQQQQLTTEFKNEANYLDDVILNLENIIQIKSSHHNKTYKMLYQKLKPLFDMLFSYETSNSLNTNLLVSQTANVNNNNNPNDTNNNTNRSRSFIQNAANNFNNMFQQTKHKHTKSLANSSKTNNFNYPGQQQQSAHIHNNHLSSSNSTNMMSQQSNKYSANTNNTLQGSNQSIKHHQRKQIINSPTNEQKVMVSQILLAVSDFVKQEFLEYLPSEPCYLSNDKKILDFLFITDAMVKSKGHDDPFMKAFSNTQLLTYYLEGHFERIQIKQQKYIHKQKQQSQRQSQ